MHSQVLYHEGGDASGLQVLCDGDEGGEGGGGGEDGGGGGEGGGGEGGGWVDVGARPGALIVNVGDILHYWSNGLLKRARRRSLLPRGLSPLIVAIREQVGAPPRARRRLALAAEPRLLLHARIRHAHRGARDAVGGGDCAAHPDAEHRHRHRSLCSN